MTWLLGILILLLAGFIYLSLAPFYLEIDTESGLLRVRFHRLASIRLVYSNSSLTFEVDILGWKKQTGLTTAGTKRNKKEQAEATEKKKRKKPGNISFRTIKAVLRTFKINKCIVDLDFGDEQWNGILYPVFYWIGRFLGKPIQINFEGKTIVTLEIENNLARIIKAFILNQFIFKNRKNGQSK